MTTAAPKSDAIKGALYDLLAEKLPHYVTEGGTLSVASLAEDLEMSAEGVYRWLRADEISKRGRSKLIALGNLLANTSKLRTLDNEIVPLNEDDLRPFL